jgi:hypothetical protein
MFSWLGWLLLGAGERSRRLQMQPVDTLKRFWKNGEAR